MDSVNEILCSAIMICHIFLLQQEYDRYSIRIRYQEFIIKKEGTLDTAWLKFTPVWYKYA